MTLDDSEVPAALEPLMTGRQVPVILRYNIFQQRVSLDEVLLPGKVVAGSPGRGGTRGTPCLHPCCCVLLLRCPFV